VLEDINCTLKYVENAEVVELEKANEEYIPQKNPLSFFRVMNYVAYLVFSIVVLTR